MINKKQFPQFLAPYCIAFEISVGAVIFRRVDDDMQYLLLKYRNGHWEFPRGKVEDNETEQETMRREIEEETGITDINLIEGFRHTMKFSYIAHGTERAERKKEKSCIFIHKKAIFYLAQTQEQNAHLSHEHKNFVWSNFDDAMQKLTYDNAKIILTAAHNTLRKN